MGRVGACQQWLWALFMVLFGASLPFLLEELHEDPTPLCLAPTLLWLQGRHSLAPFVADTKKRRKPRQKIPERILLRDRSTSPCLPPTPLPPLPLPPPWSPW